jgi:glucan 1,3-beta-glucosidase
MGSTNRKKNGAIFLFLLFFFLFPFFFSFFFFSLHVGWLVLESWITPTLYSANGVKAGLGEWGFCETLGKEAALSALTTHWDTWVTFAHLQTLQQAGVNWIRVPVGYWIVDIQADEPFVSGGLFYLQRLLGWAEQLQLRVLVDLHGAPGSQNGHDNSGHTGPIQWNTPANINRTV